MSATTTRLPFQQIAPHLAIGAQERDGWRSISTIPLTILVGVTGVGKSTLVDQIAHHSSEYLLLPDRRDLTDQLIISTMQVADGLPVALVKDRGQRFAYTRRYREQYEGGMAHALTQLWISDAAPNLLLFDGLRGANEVTYAAATLPLARFVMLDAPEITRLQRLLGRGDVFDRIQVTSTPAGGDATSFADLGVPEASTLFSPADEATILGWLHNGIVTTEDLLAKLQIVIEERRSYDPVATLAALQRHASDTTLYIDTVTHPPASVASQVIAWLNL
jgi:hypothetical protein